MKKRILSVLLALGLALPALVLGEVGTNNAVSVTSTAQTVTFTTNRTSVTVINDAASANELYFRLFWNGESVVAATTATGIRLEKGESISFSFNGTSEVGRGYLNISLVTDTAETATCRLVWK